MIFSVSLNASRISLITIGCLLSLQLGTHANEASLDKSWRHLRHCEEISRGQLGFALAFNAEIPAGTPKKELIPRVLPTSLCAGTTRSGNLQSVYRLEDRDNKLALVLYWYPPREPLNEPGFLVATLLIRDRGDPLHFMLLEAESPQPQPF